MTLTKAQAKALSILDVAKSLGMDLKRSSHNEYYWTEHDALKLNTTKNTWTWYSRELYGDTIGLVQEIKQVSYKEAISFLAGGSYQTITPHQEKREPFKYYLERYEHPDFEIGRQYLKNDRGLSDDTIDTFLASGNLAVATYKKGDYFEPVVVFKSRDPGGNLLGATLQGIVENRARYLERGRLKKILPNSDGSVGFSLTLGQPKRLVFAESPIDLMSYYELHKNTLHDVRLVAMDGLKRSVISRHLAYLQAERTGRPLYGKDKIRQSLTEAKKQGFFTKDENKQLITIAVDNDTAGRGFIEKLQKDGIPVMADLPPKRENQTKMDWNDVLKHLKKESIQMENQTMKKTNKDQLAQGNETADKVAPTKSDRTIAELIKAKDTVAVNRYLKDGVKNFLNSEKYKAFLTQMSKLNQYSPRNLQLLLAQKPDATYLASYYKWKKDFGRQVKKGEKALSVIVPVTYLKKDKEGNILLDKNGQPETVTTFRLQGRAFDVSQTEGKDLPKMVTNLKEQLTDEQYANLYRAAMTIAKNNQLTVRFDKLPKKINGFFNPNQQEIVLQQDNMSKDQIVKTFLHELAHAELHQTGQQAEIAKHLKELQAESTAFVVASYYGLDTDNYTFSYLASWTDDKKTLADLEAQLEVVHQEAQSLIKRMDDTLAEIQLRQERQKGHQFSNKLEQFKEKAAKDIATHKEQQKEEQTAASKKAKGVSK